jgi:RND family efflux transporter MFP subunit
MTTSIRNLNRRQQIYIGMAFVVTMAALTSLAIERVRAHGGEQHGPSFQVGQATEIVEISAEARDALNIRTAVAEERTVFESTRVPGVIRPDPGREALVTSPTAGVIRSLHIRPGDRVQKGDLIAIVASSELGQAQGEATSAAGDEEFAEANFTRQQYLFERGISSAKDVDEARASVARARGARSGAGAVIAPISGIIADRPATLGQAVDMGDPIAHIIDPSVVVVDGDVPEAQAHLLKQGGALSVRAQAYPDDEFEARISFISPMVHEEKRAIHIIAELKNPQTFLRPGMFVDVSLRTDSAPAEVAVPVRAIVDEGVERYVFVEQKPGEYNRVRVALGPSDGQWVAVRGPIFAGDKVVVDGTRVLEMAALTGGGKKPGAEAGMAPAASTAPGPADTAAGDAKPESDASSSR